MSEENTDIIKKYTELKELVAEKIPDRFKVINAIIENREYVPDDYLMPINFNPYKMGGKYYPAFYSFTYDPTNENAPKYRMTKGEEKTISIWNAILDYQEFNILADLFILCFIHDNPKITESIYTSEEQKALISVARKAISDADYGEYDPRCKRYLVPYDSEVLLKYERMARRKELVIDDTTGFVDVMMEIITDEYNAKHFIVENPDFSSVERARDIQEEAFYEFQRKIIGIK